MKSSKSSNEKLKVSFYLKKNINRNGCCPVMGRLTIGNDMVQFSCKLDADSTFWDTRAGRVNGKSHHARKVNVEIDKINVVVNAKYKEIISLRGTTTANEVKKAAIICTPGKRRKETINNRKYTRVA